jgi:hypothetical protein
MSLLWEPIREAASRRGWRFVAKEVATLLACFAVAAVWVLIWSLSR